MNNSIGSVKKDNSINEAIFNFAWDRLENIKEWEIEGYQEIGEDIDNVIDKLMSLLPDKEIKNLVNEILDKRQEQANLMTEKAYRMGMSDGIKFINHL